MQSKRIVTSILASSLLVFVHASPIRADNTSQWGDPTSGELSYNGRVGIGTASPTQRLHIKESGKGTHPNLRIEDAKGDGIHVGYNTRGDFGALNSNTDGVFHWDTLTWKDGRVGVGTSAPTQRFHVKEKATSVHPNIRVEDSKGDGIHVGYNTTGNFGALNSNTGGAFHWDTLTWKDGRVGIGGTPTATNYMDGTKLRPRLDVHGQVRITDIPVWNGPSAYDLTWAKGYSNGVAYSPNKALISREGSSRRYKRDIRTADEDFAKILKVEVKSFQMQPGFGPPDTRNLGYIAEDLDKAGLRNLVVYDEEGRPDGIRYKQVALYVNEVVKSQQKMIEGLQKKLAALTRKVEELSGR
jgi:Chaperone of endosialidase